METNRRRALGKGLEELFNTERMDIDSLEEKIVSETPKEEIVEIDIKELRSNPYQPRKVFDEKALEELAASIKEHGVFQPIIVKKSIKGYEIIAGERRVKASTMAGLEKIPAIIRDFSDVEMMEIALLENLQRENLNPLEEAGAYKKLLETLDITQEELAKRLGKSRSHITNMIGILDLPSEVKEMINEKKISMSHARVLSKLENKDEILKLAEKIANEELNVRDLEEITRKPDIEKKKKIIKTTQSEYQELENNLSDILGTRVKIKNNKLEITFTNINDLNRILEIMKLDKE